MAHDVVILASECPWTRAIANTIRQRFGDAPVIMEDKQSVFLLLRRRLRRLGLLTVLGQLGFALVSRTLRPLYRRREQKILARERLDTSPISSGVTRVPSVNDDQTIELLRRLRPKVIIVSQTRIVARRVLESTSAIFINIHPGITPQYRGHHGAYWALAKGDVENCGVTVHCVDAGVDTGPIIAQARTIPSPADSYFTYHWSQLAVGLPLLITAVENALSGKLSTSKPPTDVHSRQYYNPTLWGYLWTGLRQGVW